MRAPGSAGEPEPPGPDGEQVSDADLLAAHVGGDPDAFAQLVARHRDRLWGVAVRTLGDREEAADALQDALLSAYRRADSYRGEAAVTTWLHRVVVNACLDRVRRRRSRPTVPLPEHEPADPADAHARTETRLDVRAALAQLPDHQRQALVLVDMHGLSVAEAAAVLEVAEGTVKSRCARGRAALVPLLRPHEGPAPRPAGNPRVGSGVQPSSTPVPETEGGRA